ncbi:unnamed protein product [Owenia fusiformis]|uniref:Uncharacterized protein n=1 Tax=Owenia fusiformis TaxID=6347 RepID=A0A8J1U5G6_OWEFU|nr:unnamed protein product [Owenia fusiformis]
MTDVSIVVCYYNAEKWLEECIRSVYDQDFIGTIEFSLYNDGSKDSSYEIVERWRNLLEERGISVKLGGHSEPHPKGVGFAKNCAVRQSNGEYICFLDADDVLRKDRVTKQYEATKDNKNIITGSQIWREPEGSTVRFTEWANTLTPEQLYTQMFTSHGPTVVMPTWFCAREVFERVGGFNEGGKGVPEDMLFFYEHIRQGGSIQRVDEPLLMYRYHPEATTFSIHEDTIWGHRIAFFQERVLSKWSKFTVWNAGKQGRKFYRSISQHNRNKVLSFCDVDEKKIKKGVYIYEDSEEMPRPKVPIIHFSQAKPPIVICVKQALTSGSFEENLASLGLTEGRDYYHFN